VSFVRFSALEEIQPGRNKSVRIGLRRIVVFNVDGDLHALEDACAHMKAPLSNGRLKGAEITCSWHGWTYDVTTGQRKGKDQGCVRTFSLKVESGTIMVDPAVADSIDPAGPGSCGEGDDEFPPAV
jgi:3-phenylpropionate/trans-cinnamate dioxygenase ferredoxin subunit